MPATRTMRIMHRKPGNVRYPQISIIRHGWGLPHSLNIVRPGCIRIGDGLWIMEVVN